jgi:hypothetical protein
MPFLLSLLKVPVVPKDSILSRPNEVGSNVNGKSAPVAGNVQEITPAKMIKLASREPDSPAQFEFWMPDFTFRPFQFVQ